MVKILSHRSKQGKVSTGQKELPLNVQVRNLEKEVEHLETIKKFFKKLILFK